MRSGPTKVIRCRSRVGRTWAARSTYGHPPPSWVAPAQVTPDLVGTACHCEGGVQDVDVPAFEPEDLAEPEMAPGSQLDGDSPLFWHGSGQGVDFGNAQHRASGDRS